MRRLWILACVLGLAACASPEPSYYTLAAVRGTQAAGGPALVELRRPGLAGYLDRPEIVRSNSAYQLQMLSGERWGEPFGDLVGRILAEDLNSRLPGTSVFTSAGSISAVPDATVEIDIQRFDLDPSGQVVLLAQVAVSRGRGRGSPSEARAIRLTQAPASVSTAGLVAAMSTAMGQLADQLADMLRRK